MRRFRNANGLESIPNLLVWKSLADNVKVNIDL